MIETALSVPAVKNQAWSVGLKTRSPLRAVEKSRTEKDGEWDYGCACYESALKAFGSLCEDGHSGFSIGLTKAILNRLINNKPLLPIEDTDEVWSDISDMSGLRGRRA